MTDPMRRKLRALMDAANGILEHTVWMGAKITGIGFMGDSRMMCVEIEYNDDEGRTIIARSLVATAFASHVTICEAAARAFLANADGVLRADWLGEGPEANEEPGLIDWAEAWAHSEDATLPEDAASDVPEGTTIQ